MQVGICLLVQKKVCCFSRSIMDSCNCLVSRSHCNIRLHRNYSVTSFSFVCSYVCVSCVNKMDVDILSIKLTAEKVSNLIGFFFSFICSLASITMSLFKHQTESIGLFLVHLNGRHIMYIYLLQIADCAVADGNTQEMRSSYKLHRANPDST